ncbi:lysophospholipid acyltransferase family protein [Saccharopolyspora thermophila]|nr:lysophospholipid acyltransferase family protein [Saccharopolyspora subtropica]
MRVDQAVIALTGRLEVTGDVPDELRGRPLVLAANHIGNIDALVLIAACRKLRLAPRFLATGGLFDTPVLGHVLRACGHVRVDRGKSNAGEALGRAVDALAGARHPVLMYPEGRITLEPEMWPERGKTGVARIALAARAAVVPISQWGAHEAMCYGMVRVESARDLWILLSSWLRALLRRPVLKVHFGAPVDLSDLSADRVGDAARARDRIMRAITAGLTPLRAGEPDAPRHQDPTRPATDKRSPWRPNSPG